MWHRWRVRLRKLRSQPARAVWIEIYPEPCYMHLKMVTACEGCVD